MISRLPFTLSTVLLLLLAFIELSATAPTNSDSEPLTPPSMGPDDCFAPEKFPVLMTEKHNEARDEHSVAALEWNDKIAAFASETASKCKFEHSGSEDYGENLALGYGSVDDVVNAWVGEEDGYDFNTSDCTSSSCGHFTQVVWKATTELGCGRAWCSTDGITGW
jgi:uncharacterized protein YkwD